MGHILFLMVLLLFGLNVSGREAEVGVEVMEVGLLQMEEVVEEVEPLLGPVSLLQVLVQH
jgi:hypothetical protein